MKVTSINSILLVAFFAFLTATHLFSQESIKGVQGNSGTRWAICIGINDYQDNRIVDLESSRNDAKVLGKILKQNGQFDEVIIMTDDQSPNSVDYPKKSTIQQRMTVFKTLVKPEDLVVFFFSGHGVSNASGEGFLVLTTSYRENLNGTSLKVRDVVNWITELGVKNSLLLLDANRQNVFKDKKYKQNGLPIEVFGANQVGAVFYAAASGTSGCVDYQRNLGVFTRYIADGLTGNADTANPGGNGDKLVSFSELSAYVESGVGKWASSNHKNQKTDIRFYGDQFGDLIISTYGTVSAQPVVAMSVVSLRSEYQLLKGNSVLEMLKNRGLFDKKLNPSDSFDNKFEEKNIAGGKVVVDRATGLMWHATGSDRHMEMGQAKGWVSALNGSGYAGYKDWRLPTLEEAASLLESTRTSSGLYINPMFGTQQKYIWTGDKSGKNAAWVVFFDQGKLNRDYFFNFFFVRPVRSVN